MKGITHEVVGVGTAVLVAESLSLGRLAAAGLALSALLGSRLPDADVPGARVHRLSLLERRLPPVRWVGAVLRAPLLLAPRLRHRGITHSLPACAVASVVLGSIVALASRPAGLVAGAGLAIGYAAHVAADACTPGGVCAWAPFDWKPVWLLPPRARIRTGGLRELGFVALFVVVATTLLAVVS